MCTRKHDCPLVWLDESLGLATCPQCKIPLRTKNICLPRNCPNSPERPKNVTMVSKPSVVTRMKNFTLASISHFLKGAPTCTQEEIDIRASICVNCHLFIPDAERSGAGVCGHHTCGCNLGDEKKFLNKLAWKDQSCPLGKW